jgi:two-component system response regulator MprA
MHKILIVEDNDDLRGMLATMLLFSNYEVCTAATGAEAIARAISAEPNLIVLDLELPDLDGVVVAQAIRKNPKTTGIPIIGWSAYIGWEHRKAALDAGMIDYLVKPVHSAMLRAKIEEHLNREVKPVSDSETV